jgi:ATP adenylyltransferase
LSFEQLWAPWRLGYIQQGDAPQAAADVEPSRPLHWEPDADRSCFLCRDVADRADRENLVVARGEYTLAVLNRYPYNNGHLLVAPRRHKARLEQLTDSEHLELMQMITRLVLTLERLLGSEGFNVGLNLGKVAGAGLPGHLHWHVVPRWLGDTNFMPVLAGVNVIPQALDALAVELTRTLADDAASSKHP